MNASNLLVLNEINYPHQMRNYGTQIVKKGKIENASIEINNKRTEKLFNIQSNGRSQITQVRLKAGDFYRIKIQGMDGHWYHTKNMIYKDSIVSNVLVITGTYLPLDARVNGKILSSFYNEKGWSSRNVVCAGGGIPVGGITCGFYNSDNSYVVTIKMGPGAALGTFTGTGYLDSATIDEAKQGPIYQTNIVMALFYSHVSVTGDDGTGSLVAYGNMGGVGVGDLIGDATIKKGPPV